VAALAAGDPAAFLPHLHFAFLGHSPQLAEWLASRGYELFSKSDIRFVELLFRIARVEFAYRHALTPAQMLTTGYAERKALYTVHMLKLCSAKSEELARAAGAPPSVAALAGRAGYAAFSRTPPSSALTPTSALAIKPEGEDVKRTILKKSELPQFKENARVRELLPDARRLVTGAVCGGDGTRMRAGGAEPDQSARPLGAANRQQTTHAQGVTENENQALGGIGVGDNEWQQMSTQCTSRYGSGQPPHFAADEISAQLRSLDLRMRDGLAEMSARMGLLERRMAAIETNTPARPLGVSDLLSGETGSGLGLLEARMQALENMQPTFEYSRPPPPQLAAMATGGFKTSGSSDRYEDGGFNIGGGYGVFNTGGGYSGDAQGPRTQSELAQDVPQNRIELFDPRGKASADEYLLHLERRFEATEALVGNGRGF